MTPTLRALIYDAVALGGVNLCAQGCDLEAVGGRACPYSSECPESQAVYQCRWCGGFDYGEIGGPAHRDCLTNCSHAPKGKE